LEAHSAISLGQEAILTSQIANLSTAKLASLPPGIAPQGTALDRYDPKVAMLGLQLGAKKLGFNLIALPPGKRGFPFHSHRTNEEAFLVLHGTGEVRLGAERFPIGPNDLISAPAGGPDAAHQIINTGSTELRYLAISTNETPDVIEYPDTGKFRVLDIDRGGGAGFDAMRAPAPSAEYWEGE
jgi:uncharacterized cupin superfamily protein